MNYSPDLLLATLIAWLTAGLLYVLFAALLVVFGYMVFQWFKHRKREEYALDFVTLMVRLPKDNEIKIDAAEQMFAGLYSLKKTGWVDWLIQPEHLFAFEIVALKESITFYVSCPRKIRDLVEKQIHGAYPAADIKERDEVNIFSEKGKVSFATLALEKATYYPLKTYKDLPTDGLSLITSAMSKMGDGEGAMIQILLQPENRSWQNKGRGYMQKEKKREADPEKASYAHDPKEMEAIPHLVQRGGR